MTSSELTSGKSLDFEYGSRQPLSVVPGGCADV
jgi:hypothetical protein